MVTAELAVAMPAVVVVLAVALFTFGLAVDELRCVDAARAGARAAARGDAPGEATAVARRAAPTGSQVRLAMQGSTVTVTVSAPTRFSAVLSTPWHPRASAVSVREQDGP